MKKLLFFATCLLFAGSVSAQYSYPPAQSPYGQSPYGQSPYNQNPYRRPRKPRPQQEFQQNPVKVGFEVGLNVANTVNAYNSYYGTSTIAGLNAGVTVEIPLSYNLSFELEGLYSQKGYAAETYYGDFTQHFNFVDVPLLAKIKLAPGFSFLLGPQFSYLVNANTNYSYNFTGNTLLYNYDKNGNDKFIDGVFGLQVDITPNIDLHARYTIDLNQVNSTSVAIPDYRNQVSQIGIGFKF